MLKCLTLEMLKNRIPEMLLKHCLMNRTLVSVLFLDEPELERVLAFLKEELGTSCGLRSLHTSIMRDRIRGDPKIIRKGIVLSDDLSGLIPLFDESKSFGQEYGDHIVQWLFEGDEPIGEKLEEWTNYKEVMKRLGMELPKIIQAEMHQQLNTWEKKYKHWRLGKLWQDMENKCVKEDKSGNSQSCKSLFLKRQQEIENEKSDDDMRKLELKIIRIIFEAKTDKDIKMLIQMHKDQLIGKFFTLDAIILGTYAAMCNTWEKLMMISSFDYQSIVVPLLKSFMQTQLVNMVDKDSTEKPNVAIEAPLSELDLDDKKNTEKGGDGARQGLGKLKNRSQKR